MQLGSSKNPFPYFAGAVHRILLVDDHKEGMDTLALGLRKRGYEVQGVSDATEALSVIETFQPDGMIIEPVLAGLGGYELARRIRHEAWGEQVKLIALTGYGHPECRILCEQAGFDRYLLKPMAIDILVGHLRGQLRQRDEKKSVQTTH